METSEIQGPLDRKVTWDKAVQPVLREPLERVVPLVLWVSRERLEPRAPRDLKVLKVLRVNLALLDR